MNSTSTPKRHRSVRSQTLLLGAANSVVTLMRFCTPMAMVRLLDQEAFGVYRLFWLFGITAVMIAPLGIPRSLLYIIPRSDQNKRNYFIYQTLFLVGLLALLATLVAIPGSPFVKPELANGTQGYLLPVFIFCWVISQLLDFLPTAENRVGIQSAIITGSEFLRQVLLVGTAFVTRSFVDTLIALTIFSILKTLFLIGYVYFRFGLPTAWLNWADLKEQVSFGVPMGVIYMLNNLGKNAEQWLAALLFTTQDYAIFVVGAVNIPVLTMLRQTLTQVTLPKMSKAHFNKDYKRVLYLAQSANFAVAIAYFPIIMYLLCFAHSIVEIAFTDKYIQSTQILQVYLLIYGRRALDMKNILMLYKQQKFLLRVNIILVVLSIAISLFASLLFGIVGIAMGSVIAAYIQVVIVYRRVSQCVGVPISKLQDWKGFLFAFVSAALAAGGGMWVVEFFALEQPLVRIGVSFVIVLALYPLLLMASGYGWVFKVLLGKGAWRNAETT
ncbi:lipopolysaccharide biosynthesis protein [Desulfovibrio inopinatus]|uniref:lipopolysaccharide biosynthesis protein n=1 Tax=Desulfovibrio inopinatus TaxID=102109 RepID=UPI00316ACED7